MAQNKELLVSKGIFRIVNAAADACDNYHACDASFAYTSIHLLDSPREEIGDTLLRGIAAIVRAEKITRNVSFIA